MRWSRKPTRLDIKAPEVWTGLCPVQPTCCVTLGAFWPSPGLSFPVWVGLGCLRLPPALSLQNDGEACTWNHFQPHPLCSFGQVTPLPGLHFLQVMMRGGGHPSSSEASLALASVSPGLWLGWAGSSSCPLHPPPLLFLLPRGHYLEQLPLGMNRAGRQEGSDLFYIVSRAAGTEDPGRWAKVTC